VLRPSAKLVFISFFSIVIILISSSLFFYMQVKLETNPVGHSSKIEFEKGSLVDERLAKFFIKAISGEKKYLEFKELFSHSSEKSRAKSFMLNHLSYNVSGYANNCVATSDCSQIYIPLEEISSSVWRGLIGIEDNRFLKHQGLDWRSIVRAFYVNLKAGKIVQGGSTLTQQLAKNIFLSSERTFTRKAKEALYSFILELKYSKHELINAYLNNVYWGSFKGLKVYGIKSASLFYFNKHPNELNEFEASILISMLKGPGLYSPFNKNKKNIIQRSNIVFQKLIRENFFLGKIPAWNKKQWSNWFRSDFSGRFELLSSFQKVDKLEFSQYVFVLFLEKKIKVLKNQYPNGEFAYHVLGVNNKQEQINIFSRKSVVELPKNIGSLLKPFVYSKLFRTIDPRTKISTEKIILKLKSGEWAPSDHFDDKEFVTLDFALLKSLNIPYIRAVSDYGFEKIEKFLDLKIDKIKKPLSEYPAQLLGSIELKLREVLTLYNNFFKLKCTDPGVAKVVKILSSPQNSTTARWVGDLHNARFFGKTGTSNNGYDNWYVFYDSRDLYVVWIGHVGSRNIGRLALSGGGVSFDVLRNFLTSRAKNIGQNICDQ
jgi:penicillin-binding protein 1B